MPETGGEGSPDRRFFKLFLHLVLEIIACGDTSLNAIWAVATANPVARFRIFLGTALGLWQAISDNAAPKSIQSTGVRFDARRATQPQPCHTASRPMAKDARRDGRSARRARRFDWSRTRLDRSSLVGPLAARGLCVATADSRRARAGRASGHAVADGKIAPRGRCAHGQRSVALSGVDGRCVGDLHVLWAARKRAPLRRLAVVDATRFRRLPRRRAAKRFALEHLARGARFVGLG